MNKYQKMSKTNFQSLKEITTSLNDKVNQLSNGQLSLSDVESLAEEARDLYERLVIIRFKAYETKDRPAEITGAIDIVEPTKTAPEPQKKPVESEPKPEEDDSMMMFDFSANDEAVDNENDEEIDEELEAENITEEAIEADAEPLPEIIEASNETEEEDSPENKPTADPPLDDRSLNDNYKKADASVSAKFEKAAIADLKEHIGINRKFLYVNELFNGDGNAYNAAIGTLNTCGSKNEAFNHLEKLKQTHEWNEENGTVSGFVELVERRYLG